MDIFAASSSVDAPWPRPESWEDGAETVLLSSAPDGNTKTGSSPASLVCPAGRWTASGSLRGSILKKEGRQGVWIH